MIDHLEKLSQNIMSVIEDIVAEQKWGVLTLLMLIPLAIGASAVVGHLMGSYALARIAKKQGAGHKMVFLCWVPFLRYFAIGKLSERCDARRGKEIASWNKLTAYVGMPLMLAASLLFWIVIVMCVALLLGVTAIAVVDAWSQNLGQVPKVFEYAATVFVLGLYLLATLVGGQTDLLFLIPLLGIVLCAVLSAVIGAVGLAISYVCYAKILREYFRSPALGVLIAVSAVLGVFPITLLVASFREPLPAVAYEV